MDLPTAIRAHQAARGITQEELAKRAGVTQEAVSRASRQHPRRMGAQMRRLSLYMQQHAERPEAALEAATEIWDGSEAHAEALAGLIRASKALWPALREG